MKKDHEVKRNGKILNRSKSSVSLTISSAGNKNCLEAREELSPTPESHFLGKDKGR